MGIQPYMVTYAKKNMYAVLDTKKHKYVFTSPVKSECITEAQKLHGFTPVDGDETTYGNQIRAFMEADGHPFGL